MEDVCVEYLVAVKHMGCLVIPEPMIPKCNPSSHLAQRMGFVFFRARGAEDHHSLGRSGGSERLGLDLRGSNFSTSES